MGVRDLMNTYCMSKSFFVGESVYSIFNALLMVTRSLCADRGSSPLLQMTEEFGEDLNAPLQSLKPLV